MCLVVAVTLNCYSHNMAQIDLFDLMLYVYSKQFRSCWDGQLLNHIVLGKASLRQFTSIKCPFFASN